ncbi:AAA-like domain-containing protein [Lyngbya sp. CCY1209]|uniref:AAA-like domain-containing protein n=1 Tax=Lyngbya sp. CCY1209 TaxID=2886103 RepID=UPI002D208622|nr:AAA-like domain-containing protein [Lyngbya sp. CCY1209]MEB3887191.1 AAA-like domain-containing protein [Lyngbya sp. CCY1209]
MGNRNPYQVGGSLSERDTTYVYRRADRALYDALLAGEFCYVFNARQMGKSSLRVRIQQQLKGQGYRCIYLDMTQFGSENVSYNQWYKGLMFVLLRRSNLSQKISFKERLKQWNDLPIIQQLGLFIDEILEQLPDQKIFIFVDEIDSILSLPFPVNDFFALIRLCHELRPYQTNYRRLTWALFGVATPSDLIRDRTRTPFNIGRAIELQDFQFEEAQVLLQHLPKNIRDSRSLLRAILDWTGGQPLLTQKLCQYVTWQLSESTEFHPTNESKLVAEIVENQILEDWESQDNPEHLRTIRNRLLYDDRRAGKLLGLYQKIIEQDGIISDNSPEQTELLLSGLVARRGGKLQVKNRIYQTIFNEGWIREQLDKLRPYSQALNGWVASNFNDDSWLLRGYALQEMLLWGENQSLGDLDYRFLAASQTLDRKESVAKAENARLKEVEARLESERDRNEEQRRSLQRQRILLAGVSIALAIATGLGLFARGQYRLASLRETEAVVRTSEALYASNQPFEALLEAIRSQQQLDRWRRVNPALQTQADGILERIILNIHQRNRLDGHEAAVMTVDISPDGKIIATAGVDMTVKLWDQAGTVLTTLEGHSATIRVVKFTPDGQFIVSAGDDGNIKIWTFSGQLKRTIATELDGVWDVDFSPDGQTLVAVGSLNAAEFWRPDGTLVERRTFPTSGAYSVAYSPDGDRVAIGRNDAKITLWYLNQGREQTLEGHGAGIFALAFSPDGERLISGSQDQTIKVWQKDGKLLDTLTHHGAGILDVDFSSDGQTFVASSYDKTISLWTRNGILLNTLKGHKAAIFGVVFSPECQTIASAGADNTTLLWQHKNPFYQALNGLGGLAMGAVYSHDGQTFVTTGEKDNLLFLSLPDLTLKSIAAQQFGIVGLSLHPTANQMLSTGGDKMIKIRRLDGTVLRAIGDHDGVVMGADWRPTGDEIVSATASGHIYRWNSEGILLNRWLGHSAPIWDITYSPDGRQFATAGNDGTVKLWSREGNLLHVLDHDLAVWRVAFSSDGEYLISGSGDKTAKIWRKDGTLIATLKGHQAAVWGVAFSPDRPIVATSSIDETVKLWTMDGELLTTLKGHTSGIRSLVFRPDGKVLASAGDDKAVYFWNVPEILQLQPLDYACDWVGDYLRTNPRVTDWERNLCRSH